MRIVNVIFSSSDGGIEQAFVDYCQGLRGRKHELNAIVASGSPVHYRLNEMSMPVIAMRAFGEWDIFATHRLRNHIKALNPDVVIAHSGRAYALCRKAIRSRYPLVGVVQKYTARFTHMDAVFTPTHDLMKHVSSQGVAEDRIFYIPNMVDCRELPHRLSRKQPPVISSMGRLVPKKGFNVFIDALRILKERHIPFRAVLGGDGQEGPRLKRYAKAAGLDDTITFPGWVKDKRNFYLETDIFCLPSLHEPFGIVLLEAFRHGVPVVATDSEGPLDIITPNYDALIVPKGNASALAEALARLIENPQAADNMAANAFAKTKLRFSMEVVSEKIEQALSKVISNWKQNA